MQPAQKWIVALSDCRIEGVFGIYSPSVKETILDEYGDLLALVDVQVGL